MIPNSEFLAQVNKDKTGAIIVNERCETNIPGLFVAGGYDEYFIQTNYYSVDTESRWLTSIVDYFNKS